MSTTNMPNTDQLAGRNAGIDLMRGLAIVLVIIHHVALRIPLAQTGLAAVVPLRLLKALNWGGQNAVTIFFVISGFLITSHAMRRWGSLSHLNWKDFSQRRAARILPCLVVLVAVLSALDLAHVPDYTIIHADQSLPRAILAAFGLHLNWYEGRTGYLPGGWDVLWSLSIEEAFYVGFPIFCLLTARRSRLRVILFAGLALSMPLTLAALTNAPEIWQEKAYLPGMSAIAMGICAALLAAAIPRERRMLLRAPIGIVAAIAFAFYLLNEPLVWHELHDSAPLILTSAAALLLMSFSWKWATPYTEYGTAWLRSFGLMSYEIYISHMFVVFPLVGLFHWSGGDMRTGWLWFLPALALSWVLGYAIDRFLSRPADRWLLRRRTVDQRTNYRSCVNGDDAAASCSTEQVAASTVCTV